MFLLRRLYVILVGNPEKKQEYVSTINYHMNMYRSTTYYIQRSDARDETHG